MSNPMQPETADGPGTQVPPGDALAPPTHLGSADDLVPATHLGNSEDLVPPTFLGDARSPLDDATLSGDSELPEPLRVRFDFVAEYPPGGEANVFHVRDRESGQDTVVKLYHRGIEIDADLYEIVAVAEHDHVVGIQDWGRVDGRAYEVLDYIESGTLVDLIRDEGPSFGTELVETVVREVVDALEHLSSIAEKHNQSFVHRDLKPANVMVRKRSPLNLVLGDFGASLLTERSRTYIDPRHTFEYAAPEIILGQTHSQKSDLWSVGIIAYLMSVGVHPLSGLETVADISYRVTIEGIDTDVISDDRVRLLCQGLLTTKVEDRWGYPELREWIAGGSPNVYQRSVAKSAETVSFEFGGHDYQDPSALAVAMAANWPNAARTFQGPSGRFAIETWLARFAQSESVRNLLSDWEGIEGAAPDLRIVLMLVHLAPDTVGLPFRQWKIDLPGLAALAAAAVRSASGAEPEAQAVSSLHGNALLPLYAELAGGRDLTAVNDRWISAEAQYAAAAAGRSGTRQSGLETQQRLARTIQARLLLAATSPAESDRLITQARETANTTDSTRSPWFVQLTTSLDTAESSADAIGTAIAIETLAPQAATEAAEALAAMEAAKRTERERRDEDKRRARAERQRRGQRCKGRDVRTVKWVVALLVTGIVPYMLGAGIIYFEASRSDGYFRGYDGGIEVLDGLPAWDFFVTFWKIGAGAVLAIAAIRLLLRRNLRVRPFGTTMVILFLAVGVGLLVNRGTIFGDAADAAALERASSPMPLSKIEDRCTRLRWWTGTSEPTRTGVVGNQCNTVRRYNGRTVEWETPVSGQIGDLMGIGPVFLAESYGGADVTVLDKTTGAILWTKVCESQLTIDKSMVDAGSHTPSNQRVNGMCDGIPFDLDPLTGA